MDMDDILNDDPFGLLDISDVDLSIFEMNHVGRTKKVMPEYIASATPVKEFWQYEDIFSEIHANLKNKVLFLKKYNSSIEINTQTIFVTNGIVGMVVENNLSHKTDKIKGERVHVVFDNGTELFLKFKSLQSSLYKDGWIVG